MGQSLFYISPRMNIEVSLASGFDDAIITESEWEELVCQRPKRASSISTL